ncbi:MAG: response regulator transcription factor [Chloroflexota bacterium]|jgi:DNA-binding response OmpR family regulator
MARILVVDDEPHITDVVTAYLEREGHEVHAAADGDAAYELALSARPDVLVLDVMLPGRSGFDVLRDLRAAGLDSAVIMLTARDDLVDRVAGLEMGADDYMTKPFEPRELVARIGAVLRRGSQQLEALSARRFLDLDIDIDAREVTRDGEPIALTRVEFDLLATLTERPGLVLGRGQLGERIYGEAFAADDRTMDSHVKNLRRKLGSPATGGDYIETVRGVGYRAARR